MDRDEILQYAEQMMLNENIDSYQVSFGDERDSYFKRYTFETGDSCMVYYPDEISSDTKISTYYPGGGFTTDWYSQANPERAACIQDYLMSNGSDKIVIMPDSVQSVGRREYIGAKMRQYLTEEYSLNNSVSSWAGFSHGATPAITSAVTYMEMNPECDPQVVVAIDGYNSYRNWPKYLASDVADSFKNTNSILIALDPTGDKNNSRYFDHYGKAGINVIKAISVNNDGLLDVNYGDGIVTKKSNSGHARMNQKYFNDGFLDFNGDSLVSLPTEGYEYYVWDMDSNDWVMVDVSEIDTYEKLVSYFGGEVNTIFDGSYLAQINDLVLKSDDKELEGYLNNIRGVIRNTNIVSNKYSGKFSSTVKMVSNINDIISEYSSSTLMLLSKLEKETKEIARISESISEIDSSLEKEANENSDTILELDEMDITDEVASESILSTAVVGTALGSIVSNDVENVQNQEEYNDTKDVILEEKDFIEVENNDSVEENIYYSDSSSSVSSSNNANVVPNKNVESSDFLNEFLEYDKIVSDNNRIVFENKDGYKLIIHKEGNVINGVEHYYDFGSFDNASGMLDNIKSMYQGNQFFEGIIQDGQYVKVIFSNNTYDGFSLTDVERLYSNLSEYNKV